MKKELLRTTEIIEEYLAPPDIHDARREKHGGFLTCIIGLLTLIAEVWLIRDVLLGKTSLMIGLLQHAAVSGLLVCYAGLMLRNKEENRFAWLLLLATATCGPFGTAGTLLTLLIFTFSHRRHAPFMDTFETIFPSLLQTQPQRIYDDILIGRDEASVSYNVIPFLDVLAFGTDSQKRTAIAKMTSNFHPNYAAAFKKALGDPSNMIRVQAATAITKIETMFLKRMITLSTIHASNRKDTVVVRALAEHYDNYAYIGLLDDDRERINRQKALDYYRQYLQLVPDSPGIRARIGRLLLRGGDHAAACDWFRECLEKGDKPELISDWYSEALFACKRYDELRAFRSTLPAEERKQESAFNPALKEALELWSPREDT
jgi:hypothetical protein